MFRQRFIILAVIAIITVVSSELFWMQSTNMAYAQTERTVRCGEVVESEFVKNYEEHIYLLQMEARETFSVSIEPVGDFLQTAIAIYGPTDISLGKTGLLLKPTIESQTLSARGAYKIQVANAPIFFGLGSLAASQGGVGLYTLFIGCSKSEGTIIKPGDIPQPMPTPSSLPTPTPRSPIPTSAPEFASIGFPGLAPVDFSSVAKVPLLPDTVMTGVIPTGNEILGFTLDAEAGDTLALSYTRVSGNMNLGVVVLSAENEVFFQASLVTSESLSTRFTLPEAGQYTIGVFRLNLVELAAVEATVFQLEGTIEDSGQ